MGISVRFYFATEMNETTEPFKKNRKSYTRKTKLEVIRYFHEIAKGNKYKTAQHFKIDRATVRDFLFEK